MIYVILIAVAIAAVLFFVVRRKKNANAPDNSQPITPPLAPGESKFVTPLGMNVITSSPLTSAETGNLDKAATDVFRDCRAFGYSNSLEHKFYTVRVKDDCVVRPSGVMAWLIRADDYNGTEFDQNPDPLIGEVFCAEKCETRRGAGGGEELTGEFTICRDNLSNMYDTTQNGIEHIASFYNGRNDLAFANHGGGLNPHRMIPYAGK